MEGKIDKNGNLEIKRKNKWKYMYCPYSDTGEGCGDWCALFGEPVWSGSCKIGLCHKIITFRNFTDERE